MREVEKFKLHIIFTMYLILNPKGELLTEQENVEPQQNDQKKIIWR